MTDGDEPLLSGSGAVSKDISDENLLENWHDVLTRWQQNLRTRPRQVQALVRKGIPEALRGEVWQLLAGCHDNADMLESYRILITKVCCVSSGIVDVAFCVLLRLMDTVCRWLVSYSVSSLQWLMQIH